MKYRIRENSGKFYPEWYGISGEGSHFRAWHPLGKEFTTLEAARKFIKNIKPEPKTTFHKA